MSLDCVILYGPNDKDFINLCIKKAYDNIENLRNIYVISYDENFNHPLVTTISEKKFPMSYEDVKEYVKSSRTGWYLQQFLKMYAHKVISNLSEYFLIIDCDTLFINSTSMFENGIPLYNFSGEYHIPYFETMKKLHPSLIKANNKSGICHHMIFKQEYLNELFALVESGKNKPFWKIVLESINSKDIQGSGFSEYETYFSFIHVHKPNTFKIRELVWSNVSKFVERDYRNNHYVSIHWYSRNNKN